MHYYVLLKVYQGCDIFLRILQYILLAYSILSWIASPLNRLYVILSRLSQPLVAPFRPISNRLIQRGLRIDLSAILAFISLSVVRNLLLWFFNWLLTL